MGSTGEGVCTSSENIFSANGRNHSRIVTKLQKRKAIERERKEKEGESDKLWNIWKGKHNNLSLCHSFKRERKSSPATLLGDALSSVLFTHLLTCVQPAC